MGVTETTQEPREYEHGGISFVDLPGCGTKNWRRETYISRLGLDTYDCFILVTADRFCQDDVWLYQQLRIHLKRRCFLVRNKFDLTIKDAREDNGLTESQVREVVERNIRENLDGPDFGRIYCTSAKHPKKYDLPPLISDIVNSQTGVKRDRAIADVAPLTKEMLQQKHHVARRS